MNELHYLLRKKIVENHLRLKCVGKKAEKFKL